MDGSWTKLLGFSIILFQIDQPCLYKGGWGGKSTSNEASFYLCIHAGGGDLVQRSDPPTEQWLDNGTPTNYKRRKTLMDKQNLMPQAAQPVNRFTTGQLPAQLAELSEEALQLHGDDSSSASILASHASSCSIMLCS